MKSCAITGCKLLAVSTLFFAPPTTAQMAPHEGGGSTTSSTPPAPGDTCAYYQQLANQYPGNVKILYLANMFCGGGSGTPPTLKKR